MKLSKKLRDYINQEIESADELDWEFQHKLAMKMSKQIGVSYKKIFPEICYSCCSDSIDVESVEENLKWFKSKPFKIDPISWLHSDPTEKKYVKLINKHLTKE